MAVGGAPAGYEGASQSGEVATHYLYFVALDEVDVGGVVVGESVGVEAGDDAEAVEVGVGDGDVAVLLAGLVAEY